MLLGNFVFLILQCVLCAIKSNVKVLKTRQNPPGFVSILRRCFVLFFTLDVAEFIKMAGLISAPMFDLNICSPISPSLLVRLSCLLSELQPVSNEVGRKLIFIGGRARLLLRWSFVSASFSAILLCVLHLCDDLPRLAARVVMIRVRRRLQFGATFSAFARHELVLLHVVLLQVIRHDCAADRRHAQASSISWRCCPFNFR